VAVSRHARDPQRLGRLLDRQAGEVAELYQLGLGRLAGRELRQRLVDGQDVLGGARVGGGDPAEVAAVQAAASLGRVLAARILDEDATHGLGRRGEEVAPAVPARVGRADQAEVRLVDQGGGLQRLPGPLPGQPRGGEPAQLVVDEREQRVGGPGVAVPDRRQDPRHVVHRRGAPGPHRRRSRPAPWPDGPWAIAGGLRGWDIGLSEEFNPRDRRWKATEGARSGSPAPVVPRGTVSRRLHHPPRVTPTGYGPTAGGPKEGLVGRRRVRRLR
jgi:hypothetical protein